MVFLDSNLFVVHRFFRRDALYPATGAFLERLSDTTPVVPLMTLLELCGAASFRLSPAEAERWLHDFTAIYPVRILNPFGTGDEGASAWLGSWADDMARYIARKMTFGDALLAREADRYGGEAIVTWNTKHFEGKTTVRVVTPDRFF